jgi:hypothetical protein
MAGPHVRAVCPKPAHVLPLYPASARGRLAASARSHTAGGAGGMDDLSRERFRRGAGADLRACPRHAAGGR